MRESRQTSPAHIVCVSCRDSRKGLVRAYCFVGDRDPSLRRLSPATSHPYGDFWILTHGDLRHTPRVRAFTEFMTKAILNKRDLMEGRRR